jgi:hypothetical protein
VKRNETQKSIPNAFNKVFGVRNRRVRGLWERNGVYYTHVRAKHWRGRVALEHSKTVAQAGEEWQALKTRSLASPAWMRLLPQVGLLDHIRRTRVMSSRSTEGLPPRPRDFQRQNRRKPWRCQAIRV